VLRGQCIRSNAGLYYETEAEFVETLRAVAESRRLNATFGANGRDFFQRNYAWPVIERKYLDMLARLKDENGSAVSAAARTGLDEPGWFARRRKTLPPAADIVAGLPSGPVLN
jgi:hypothetical protein